MIVKIVLHSPEGTARLNYDAEGRLIDGDRDRAVEIAKTATQMEVVAGGAYVILNSKKEVIAGDPEALAEKLGSFPDEEISELFSSAGGDAITQVADTIAVEPPDDITDEEIADLLADDHEELLL